MIFIKFEIFDLAKLICNFDAMQNGFITNGIYGNRPSNLVISSTPASSNLQKVWFRFVSVPFSVYGEVPLKFAAHFKIGNSFAQFLVFIICVICYSELISPFSRIGCCLRWRLQSIALGTYCIATVLLKMSMVRCGKGIPELCTKRYSDQVFKSRSGIIHSTFFWLRWWISCVRGDACVWCCSADVAVLMLSSR